VRTFGNLLAFSPELLLLAGAVLVFLLARFSSAHTTVPVALATLLAALLALATQFQSPITILDGAFYLDGFAVVVDVVLLLSAALALLASGADILPTEVPPPALPGFYLLATMAGMLAASAGDLVAVFVYLELLAVSLYVLAALARHGTGAAAALGYLVLGAAGSASLLYGLALLYGLTGETRLTAVGAALAGMRTSQPAVLLALSLLLAGFAGRLGLLPLRWWTRGFEAGVPLRVVIVVQSVGVVAGFAVLGRLLASGFMGTAIAYPAVIAAVAALAMTGGNLLALTQTSVRRLLVTSGIAQAGYGLVAFTDLKRTGVTALLVFVVALVLANLGAFSAIIAYARSVHSDAISDLAGMARFRPALALAFGLSLASMVGLPPLAGFFGKFFVLQAAVDGGYAWLAVVGVVNMLLAAFGYLRVIRVAFLDPPVFEVGPARLDAGIRLAVGLGAAGVVFMGLFLGPLYAAASYARAALLH
jgi:proton-translocating NADH-quinone oxidoreductase chain N